MSGVKDAVVNIRESEKNQMMNAVRRVDRLPAELNANIAAANRQLQGQFQQRFNQVNQRQARFEQNLSGLSSEMQALERRQHQRIQALNQQVQQGFEETSQRLGALDQRVTHEVDRLDDNIDQVQRHVEDLAQRSDAQFRAQRGEYLDLIDQQGQHFQQQMGEQNRLFSEAMTEQREALQGQIEQVADHIRQREQTEQQAAATWLKDVRLLLDNIDANTRHDKFKPGALAQIRSELSLAENNHRNGQQQVAIATAQATYMKAHELNMALAQLEQEWNLHLMQRFIESNPGLPSRFSATIAFDDYNAEQLVRIFCLQATASGLTLADGVTAALQAIFENRVAQRGPYFGNGREARKLLDAIRARQNSRILHSIRQTPQYTEDQAFLNQLRMEDIPVVGETSIPVV